MKFLLLLFFFFNNKFYFFEFFRLGFLFFFLVTWFHLGHVRKKLIHIRKQTTRIWRINYYLFPFFFLDFSPFLDFRLTSSFSLLFSSPFLSSSPPLSSHLFSFVVSYPPLPFSLPPLSFVHGASESIFSKRTSECADNLFIFERSTSKSIHCSFFFQRGAKENSRKFRNIRGCIVWICGSNLS